MGALLLLSLVGCVTRPMPALSNATLTPPTRTTRPHAPAAAEGQDRRGRVRLSRSDGAVQGPPDSSFSSQVTQGGASFLVKAMRDSGWFTPVERENLQDLLTERKIMRATDGADAKKAQNDAMAPLMPANIVLEGGIVGYDTNVRTGGAGVAYLGISGSTQYRIDKVTVNLRAIDIRTVRCSTACRRPRPSTRIRSTRASIASSASRTCCRRKPG